MSYCKRKRRDKVCRTVSGMLSSIQNRTLDFGVLLPPFDTAVPELSSWLSQLFSLS